MSEIINFSKNIRECLNLLDELENSDVVFWNPYMSSHKNVVLAFLKSRMYDMAGEWISRKKFLMLIDEGLDEKISKMKNKLKQMLQGDVKINKKMAKKIKNGKKPFYIYLKYS